MNASELQNKSLAELRDEEKRLRKELVDLRFQHGTRQLMDTASINRHKKDIARVMTAISQKSREQAAA